MSQTNKRGWIKNLLIIFLVIMLLLTLFSNTIMNRSLPEVSVSGATHAQITAQVKLSGTVSANRSRQVTLEEARTVDNVLVRRGDTVRRGDVLATLVAGESADVYNLEIELQRMEIEYKQMMLTENDSLVSYYRIIEDSKKAIAKLDTYLADYTALEMAVKACEDEVAVLEATLETAEDDLETLTDAKKALEKEQSKYSSGGYTTQKAYEKALKAQKALVNDADDATSLAKRTRSDRLKARAAAQEALDAFDKALENKEELQADLTAVNRELDGRDRDDLDDLGETLADKRAAYDALVNTPVDPENPDAGPSDDVIAALAAEIAALEEEIEDLEALLDRKAELEEALAALGTASDRAVLAERLANAAAAYDAADAAYDAALAAEEEARDRLEEMQEEGFEYFLLQDRIDDYAEKIDLATDARDEVAEQLADAEERLAEAEGELGKTPEECEEERITHTRAIEDAEAAIALAETNGAIKDETAKLNLAVKKREIDRKRKEIADLKAQISETEVKAPVGGTVASVSVVAGDEVEAETVLFEITMDEMGYTMECSVTNSQAARLHVGQEAEVQYYYWGEKPVVRISQIVGDPNSGGKNKLVTFLVEGDVSEGTSLSLAIGTAGASYDTVLPNSAIREDANGQFILRVVAKSSPLGNRYFAERLDVEVLASDATRSAVDASLSWGDYVITGASVPISAGMQVRMAEQ